MAEQPEIPTTLSGLHGLAVRDVRAAEKDPDFTLDMSRWLNPRCGGKCVGCMAGAVLYARGEDHLPDDAALPEWMGAIDDLRTGHVGLAFDDLSEWTCADIELSDEQELALLECEDMIRDAFDGPAGHAPWEVYERAADVLEKVGL